MPAKERDALLAALSQPESQATPSSGSEAGPVAAQASPQASAPNAPPPKHAFVVDGDEATLLAKVEPADRETYREAVRQTVLGNAYDALKLIDPLAKQYPDNYAVQHFSCGLAMQTGYQAMAQKVCPRVQGLASGK